MPAWKIYNTKNHPGTLTIHETLPEVTITTRRGIGLGHRPTTTTIPLNGIVDVTTERPRAGRPSVTIRTAAGSHKVLFGGLSAVRAAGSLHTELLARLEQLRSLVSPGPGWAPPSGLPRP
jgi:hypothetical protein